MMCVPDYLIPKSLAMAAAAPNFGAMELPPVNYAKSFDNDFLVSLALLIEKISCEIAY
jgi:hypothetical protein